MITHTDRDCFRCRGTGDEDESQCMHCRGQGTVCREHGSPDCPECHSDDRGDG